MTAENLIRTDILILQYLSSITSTDQTFGRGAGKPMVVFGDNSFGAWVVEKKKKAEKT